MFLWFFPFYVSNTELICTTRQFFSYLLCDKDIFSIYTTMSVEQSWLILSVVSFLWVPHGIQTSHSRTFFSAPGYLSWSSRCHSTGPDLLAPGCMAGVFTKLFGSFYNINFTHKLDSLKWQPFHLNSQSKKQSFYLLKMYQLDEGRCKKTEICSICLKTLTNEKGRSVGEG